MRPALQQLVKPYCGHCGYDLRATGVGNRCPECGKFSDAEELVIWAYNSTVTAGPLSERTSGKTFYLILLVGTFGLGVLYVAMSLYVWLGVCALLGAGVISVALLLRRSMPPKPDLDGAYQVRMSSAGIGARHGFGDMPRQPWYRDMRVRAFEAPGSLMNKQFSIWRRSPWSPVFLFQVRTNWATARELANQIGDWIEAAPKAGDHTEPTDHVVTIDRSGDFSDDT